jgi:hypothetical protein
MSDEKKYTPEEATQAIFKKVHEMLKKSEIYKASNTAHEVENGEEPQNDDAECPEYLANADIEGDGDKKAKKKPGDAAESEGESEDKHSEEPNHEEDMGSEEEKEHDAEENEADEKDEDKVEADEESESKEKDDKKEEEEEDAADLKDTKEIIDEAASENDKKKEKKEFEKSEALEKARIYDIKSKKKIADLPGNNYTPKRKKQPTKKWQEQQRKWKNRKDRSARPDREQGQIAREYQGRDADNGRRKVAKTEKGINKLSSFLAKMEDKGTRMATPQESTAIADTKGYSRMATPIEKPKMENEAKKKAANKKVEKFLGVDQKQATQKPQAPMKPQEPQKPEGSEIKGY